MKRLLDGMKYTPSTSTSVASTWERFGFRVRSMDEQKKAAQRKMRPKKAKPMATVTLIKQRVAK